MRRFNLFVIFLACPMMMFGQLKIQPNGFFKVKNNLAGNTGTTGDMNNVSFGYGAMATQQYGGANNTAIGKDALYSNGGGCDNTANGNRALYANITGDYNTVIGSSALRSNTTGSYNTAVGYYSNYTAINLTNSTAIGYNATTTASNQVRIGNSSVNSIGGQVGWTSLSDGRVKKNIRAEVPGLDFIKLLQPVTYNLDLDAIDEIQKSDNPKINHLSDSLRMAQSPEEREIWEKARANKEKQVYSGFVAQDVEKAAQSVGYDFSGIDAPENDKSVYGLRYAEFVVPLVKAVQELSQQNDAKDAAIVLLQEQINQLNAKLDELISTPKPATVAIDESGSANNFSFSIFPNPTNGFVTVDYTLYVDAHIYIELYNMYGQRVKLMAPKQNQKAGTYNVQATVADLTPGAYLVKVICGNQIESKQLIVNN